MMVSTGGTACVYQELPKDACFTKLLVGCDSSYCPGDWQELQYRNRPKRLTNMSCVNDASAFAGTVMESGDRLSCLDWDHVSFIQNSHLSVATTFKALHYHSIWIAAVPKPDSAGGGEVDRHTLRDVKIHTLLLHDVILLSCKMRYSLKTPSFYSSLLLPEDKVGYGQPWALWFLRIIAPLASLHSHTSLCSELEELSVPAWGLDKQLWQWSCVRDLPTSGQ